MVLTYLPQHECLPQPPCPCHAQHPSVLVNRGDPSPHTPKIRTVPLPLATTPTMTGTHHAHPEDGVFPLSILQGLLTNRHTDVLRSIILTTPVHIHTPTAHIGTIVYWSSHDAPGQTSSAFELFYFLQALMWQLINLPMSNYATVSEEIKAQVEMAFWKRTGYTFRLPQNQDQRILAPMQLYSGSVAGHGLLLGNDEVWGFESVSFEGYSVIHLARSTSRINWS